MKYEEYSGNGMTSSKNPDEIQSDIVEIRGDMERTLHQIEEYLSPRALFDQIVGRMKQAPDGTFEFARNLARTIRDNPIAVLLLATGASVLLMRERRGPPGPRTEGAREMGAGAKEKARSKLARASSGGRQAIEGLRERASGIRGATSHQISGARERLDAGTQRARNVVYERPLVVVGLGLAIGALFAGVLPRSQAEERIASE